MDKAKAFWNAVTEGGAGQAPPSNAPPAEGSFSAQFSAWKQQQGGGQSGGAASKPADVEMGSRMAVPDKLKFWQREGEGSSNSEGFLEAKKKKMWLFAGLLTTGITCFILSTLFVPLIMINPGKFAATYTLGSICVFSSFAVLRGPWEQVKDMTRKERLPFTLGYVFSMCMTIYFSLVRKVYVLVVISLIIQFAALAWYFISYLPYGTQIFKFMTKGCMKCWTACCGALGKKVVNIG